MKANEAITSWTVELTLPGASTNNLWGGKLSGTGPYTISNEAWNGSLASGGTATVGFIGNGNLSGDPTVSCQ